MMSLQGVGKTYPGGVQALAGLTLDIARGEIVAVVGGSGCGKSTLLRLIAGLDQPSQGRVALDGETITEPHPQIGLIFQEPRLLPWLTVAGNVGFGLGDLPRAQAADLVARLLARVGLPDKAQSWPRELSGGQAQRVAIARALAPNPQVLLLDEPFSALDAFTRVDLQDHLLDLWAQTRPRPTLLMVTHDVEEAVALADRIVVMRPHPGRISHIIDCPLPRPRDRTAPEFEAIRHAVLAALDLSLGRRAG